MVAAQLLQVGAVEVVGIGAAGPVGLGLAPGAVGSSSAGSALRGPPSRPPAGRPARRGWGRGPCSPAGAPGRRAPGRRAPGPPPEGPPAPRPRLGGWPGRGRGSRAVPRRRDRSRCPPRRSRRRWSPRAVVAPARGRLPASGPAELGPHLAAGPTKEPAIPATELMPSAKPRWWYPAEHVPEPAEADHQDRRDHQVAHQQPQK